MYRKFIFSLSVLLICSTTYSQEVLDSVVSRLQWQTPFKPSELIYIQTSKGVYETGEDLWFKAYQLDDQTFGLSDKSKTLYLQMINPVDSVVWQEKYPIENGIVSGHIYIDERLSGGDYSIKGFTRGSFYKSDTIGIISARKIKIIKNISYLGVTVPQKNTAFRFEMFPEGGNLISGILSKLAFKATDGEGNPVFVEGTIYQDDKPLCEIKSVHHGMGAVLFTPLLDRKYRIELNNGKSYQLPDIYPAGIALRLSKQDKERLNFLVSQSDSLLNQQVYLVGQMRGMLCCIAKGILKESLSISIPLKNFLYQGIAEFTLFNGSMQPIAERLVYVHPEKKLYIALEPEKNSFATREKATFKIKVTDKEGNPLKVHLGVSVYDQTYNDQADPMNILSYSYLSSQIRGRIYDPTYYFDERNNGQTEGMDLLLLTQGWRRYAWSVEQPTYLGQPFLSDEINGVQILKNKKKNEQNKGAEQLIQISGAEGNSQFIWADSAGHFVVNTEMMKVLRGGYVYLKPMLSKEFKPALELTDYFPMIDSIRKHRPDYYSIANLSQYNKKQVLDLPVVGSDSTILLNEVKITAKEIKPFRDKMMGRLDSLAQMNLACGWVCECQKHPPYLNDYLSGYTHHIYHTALYNGKRLLPVNGKTYLLIKYTSKAGGVYVEDQKEIVYSGSMFSEEELLRMNNIYRTKGYYATREFYQPDKIDIQSSIPDARNTLLWAPSIVTDEKGEATFSFYCSDINTGFIGLVEGVDGVGLLGTTKCNFRVIRNMTP